MKEFATRTFYLVVAIGVGMVAYRAFDDQLTWADRWVMGAMIALLSLANAIRALGPRKP